MPVFCKFQVMLRACGVVKPGYVEETRAKSMHQVGQVDATKNTVNDDNIEGRSEGHKDMIDNTNNSTNAFAGRRPHGKGKLAAETTCVGGWGLKTPRTSGGLA